MKLLKISNFTFFNNVFYAIDIWKFFNIHNLVVVCSFFEFGCLVILRFNATLTAKVISWQSVTLMCFLDFSHQYYHNFLCKATNYFSNMLQRWEAKIRRKKVDSTGYRTHNHQVLSPTRSLLTTRAGRGGAFEFGTTSKCCIREWVKTVKVK